MGARSQNQIHLGNNSNSDTFSKAWGSQTKWKSGSPRINQFDPVHVHSDDVAPQFKPQFDKPLPPLPDQNIDLKPPDDEQVQQPDVQHQTQRPSTSTRSSVSSIVRLARRFAVYRKGPKSKTARPSQAQLRPELPTITSQQAIIPAPLYVDKGTQTTNDLVAFKPSWISFKHLPHHQLHLPKPPRNSIQSESTASPLWSPRRFLTTTGPTDYFFSSDSSDIKPSNGSSSQLSQSSSSTETQVRIPVDNPPKLQSSSLHSPSQDSLGSYESRYSPKIIHDMGTVDRPALTRKAKSESKVPGALRSIPEAGDRLTSESNPAISHEDRNQSLGSMPGEGLQRPLRFPFQRIPSFGVAARGRNRSSRAKSHSRSHSPFNLDQIMSKNSASSTSPGSSLRQEFRLVPKNDDDGAEAISPPADDYFRIPVGTTASPAPLPVEDFDLPDHLLTSPLCPRNPKHKSGGTGVCPMHGQNKTCLSQSLGSMGFLDSLEKQANGNYNTPRGHSHMPGEFQDGAFSLEPVQDVISSGEDDYFHIRQDWIHLFRPQWMKGISEDSIPRIAIG